LEIPANLSIADLEKLRAKVDARIETLKKEEQEAAFKRLDQLASELGLTREQILARYGDKKRRAASPAAPKYKNPKDGQTWAGRGKKPAWVQEHLDRGGKLEELAV